LRKDRNYVNGPQLHKNILEWYESGKEEIPENVWVPCVDICKRLATKYNFSGYSYVDEMIDAGVTMVIKAILTKKYDPYRFKNPFAYFTQIAYNEFRRIINDEHRETYIKHKTLMNHYNEISDEGISFDSGDDGNKTIDKLVRKFENPDVFYIFFITEGEDKFFFRDDDWFVMDKDLAEKFFLKNKVMVNQKILYFAKKLNYNKRQIKFRKCVLNDKEQ